MQIDPGTLGYHELNESQLDRFARLEGLYREWNEKINVISRKDIDHFLERHLLHSLAIGRVCAFNPGAEVLDVGCGGGLPGIPLAILFPETHFTLIDSIKKKITVVEGIVSALGLTNVTPMWGRAESLNKHYDYVVGRAVTDMKTFAGWVWPKIRRGQAGTLPNGILTLKGGDLAEELGLAARKCTIYNVSDFYPGEFFGTKKVVYLPKS